MASRAEIQGLRVLVERGFKPGTRRKWRTGYFVKQRSGEWKPEPERGVERLGPAPFSPGELAKGKAPPPPTPPVPPTGKTPPSEADVAASTVTTVPPTARMTALFGASAAKALGAALEAVREEGKEKGKLSTSKYLHQIKAAQEIAPEHQAAIRNGARALLADFGLLSRDTRDKRRSANNIVVARGKKGVVATHEKNSGMVTIRAGAADDAAKFFAKNGKKAKPAEIEGAGAVIHEEIHGCSPVAGGEWIGGSYGGYNRTFIEECTTELSARKVLRDGYGLSLDLTTDQNMGAYNSEIETMRLMCAGALFRNGIDTPTDRAWWEDFLGEASIRFRSDPQDHPDLKTSYLNFARSFPLTGEQVAAAARLQGKTPKDIREGIVASFDEAVSNQAAYSQQVRKNYITPASVKEAKDILAKGKAKHPEQYANAKIWRKRNGGLLIASKPGTNLEDIGAEPLEDWMKARGMKYEAVEPGQTPVYDPDDIGPERIFMLAHNDVMGAVALAFALAERGLLRSEHLTMMAQLQDDPALFAVAVEELEPGPVVRV